MSLIKFILRRLATIIPTILVILVITFFMTRLLPGDPAMMRMPDKFTWDEYLLERKRLGLDQPIYIQFLIYMGDMLAGNWGFSYTVAKDFPVWVLINQKLPRSLEIMAISMIIAIFLGIKLGKFAGANKNTKKDSGTRIFIYFFVSMPAFIVISFFMQIYVSTPFKFLPMFGYKTPGYAEPPPITYSRIINILLSGKIYLLNFARNYLIWNGIFCCIGGIDCC